MSSRPKRSGEPGPRATRAKVDGSSGSRVSQEGSPGMTRLGASVDEPWRVWMLLGGRGSGRPARVQSGCAASRAAKKSRMRTQDRCAKKNRARWQDAVRRSQRDGRGRVGSAQHSSRAEPVRCSSRRSAVSRGRTARSPNSSRPMSRKACAVRSSRPPGAMSLRSGAERKRHGTCCSLPCASAKRRRPS